MFRCFPKCLASLLLLHSLDAATFTWDGGGADDNLTTPANWVGDIAPNPAGGDDLVFAGSTRLSPQVDVPFIAESITFNNTAAAFSLAGANPLTIGNGDLQNYSAQTQTLGCDLAIGGSTFLFINAVSGNIVVNGDIDNAGKILVSQPSAGRSVTFNGVTAGTGSFRVQGSGTTVGGASGQTYTGGLLVLGGRFEVGGSDSYLGAGTVTLQSGGVIDVNGTANIWRNISISSSGGGLEASSGSPFFTGVVSGNGELTIGGGSVRLTNLSNSYSGGTRVIGGGILRISDVAQLGSGGLSLDDGSLQFLAAESMSTDLVIGAGGGTLNTNGYDCELGGSIAGGSLTKSGSGNLNLVSNTVTSLDTLVVSQGSLATFNTPLPVGVDLTVSAGAVFSTGAHDYEFGQIGGSGNLNLNSPTHTTTFGADDSSGSLDVSLTATGELVKSGTGTYTVTADNSLFGGPLILQGGTLSFDAGNQLGSGPIKMDGGALKAEATLTHGSGLILEGGTLEVADSAILTFSGVVNGSGAIGKTGEGILVFSGTQSSGLPSITISAGSLRFSGVPGFAGSIINQGLLELFYGTTETIAASISGTGALYKTGTGEVILSGDIDLAGDTSVLAGTLSISGSGETLGDVDVLAGTTLRVKEAAGVSMNRLEGVGTVDLEDFGGIGVGVDGSSFSFGGSVTGPGGFAKRGSGTVTLTGTGMSNSLGVIEGVLSVNSADQLPSSQLFLLGGTLRNTAPIVHSGPFETSVASTGATVDTQADLTLGGSLSGGSAGTPFVKAGSGTLTLTGSQNFDSSLEAVVNAGGLRLSGVTQFGGNIVVNSELVLDYAVDATLAPTPTLDGPELPLNVSGTGAVRKTGTGTLTVERPTFAHGGGLFVDQGMLVLEDAVVTHGGGVTIDGGGLTFDSATLGYTGGTSVNGTSVLTLTDTDASGGIGTISLADTATIALNGASGSSLVAGSLTGNGSIMIDFPSGVGVGEDDSSCSFGGTVSGTGGFGKRGSGTLTLTGSGMCSSMTVIEGVLEVDSADQLPSFQLFLLGGTLRNTAPLSYTSGDRISVASTGFTIDAQADLILGSSLAGGTAGNPLVKSGPGKLTLTGSHGIDDYLNATVTQGTLCLNGLTRFGGSLVVNTELVFDYGSDATLLPGSDLGISDIPMLVSGTGSVRKTGIGVLTIEQPEFTHSGGLTQSSGGLVLDDAVAVFGGGVAVETGSLTISDASVSYPGGTVVSDGGSFLVENSSFTHPGGTTLNGSGSLTFDDLSPFSHSGGIDINGGGTLTLTDTDASAGVGQVTLSDTGTIALNGTVGAFLDLPSLTGNGSLSVDFGSGVTLGSDDSSFTFGGDVSGQGQFAKVGAGTLTLTGSSMCAFASIGGTGVLSVSSPDQLPGTLLWIYGGTLRNTAAFTYSNPGGIEVASPGAFLDNQADLTLGAALSGSNLEKAGPGRLVLTVGPQSQGLNLTNSEGVLELRDLSSFGGNVINNSEVELNYSVNQTLQPTSFVPDTFPLMMTGSGSVTKTGSGELIVDGHEFNLSGGLSVEGGNLTFADTPATFAGIDISASRILILDDSSLLNADELSGGGILSIGSGCEASLGNNDATFSFRGTVNGVGNVVKVGSGIMTLTGSNLVFGTTRVEGGTLDVGQDPTRLGSGGVLLDGGAIRISGSPEITQSITLGTNHGTIDVPSGSPWISGPVSGTGGLFKAGTGTLELRYGNSYSGTTRVEAGTLLVTNAVFYGTGYGDVEVGNGALLAGTGTSFGTVTVEAGATVSAGLSPGVLSMGGLDWEGGGINTVEINDTTSGAGTGWDVLSVDGTLTINATSGVPFVIDVDSLTPANLPGSLAGFARATDYSWEIVQTTGGISGFSAEKFVIDSSGFANDLDGGVFAVSVDGNNLVLEFNAAVTPYNAWLQSKFSAAELADPTISGDDADIDRDGLTTLQEYAFGGEPKLADSGSVLPTGALDSVNFGDTYLTLEFPRLLDRTDINYRVIAGDRPDALSTVVAQSLGGAATAGVNGGQVTSVTAGNVEMVTSADNTPVSTANRRFMAVLIERP
ncbi:hypothetical protein HAHE_19210 [Haloferula helveola]|uniref:Autotransporter-associated beta strand repeat-containing protein n=1 Tax=Haloferula helveola TaxID=490095 RepID=A0ABM7RLM0_9BACT|nr:hypothetical protein HAHE_19210 [Haloferula helveola]